MTVLGSAVFPHKVHPSVRFSSRNGELEGGGGNLLQSSFYFQNFPSSEAEKFSNLRNRLKLNK